jgi:phage gp29-like protein
VFDRVREAFRVLMRGVPPVAPVAPSSRAAAPASSRLSLERPRGLPDKAPTGRVSRDLVYYDGATLHPSDGLTPQSIRRAFRLAEQGYPQLQVDLNNDLIEGDAHLRNLFKKLDEAIAGKPYVTQPGEAGDEAARVARAFDFALRRLPMQLAAGHLLTHDRHGYAAVEIEWGILECEGRPWVAPVELVIVPTRRFRIGSAGMVPAVRLDELRIFNDLARPQGDELEPGKWIVIRCGTDPLARAGLMRTAAPLAMGKRFGFRDWLILSEKYGIPMPIAKYAETASDEAKDVARLIIENLGSDGGAVVPHEIELKIEKGIDVKEALQAALIAFANREMSKLVNGSTLANDNADSGGASYALGEVHDGVRFEAVQAKASTLHEAIDTQLAAPFCRFNSAICSPPRTRWQVARDYNPEALSKLAVRLKNELGMPVSMAQLYEECGVRPPVDDKDSAPGMPMGALPTGAGDPP